MRFPLGFWRKWHGWAAASGTLLLGFALIVSDRVQAHHIGDRSWIIHPKVNASQTPWPKQADEIILPVVKFRFTPQGSGLSDIVDWIGGHAHVHIEVNWRALARANIGQQSPMWFDGTNVPLPVLLDALAANVRDRTGTMAKLAWTAEPDRAIYLTTAQDFAEERRWREQRAKEASPQLRKALDRIVPAVDLYVTPVEQALQHCARVSGVEIDTEFSPYPKDSVETYIEATDVTLERVIELILRRRAHNSFILPPDERGDIPPLRFKAEGDRLVVFRKGGER